MVDVELKYVGKCLVGVLVLNGSLFVSYVLLCGFFVEFGVVYEGVCYVDCDNLFELFVYFCWDGKVGYCMCDFEVMLVVVNLVDCDYYVNVMGFV